jgi:hypothetical protein
VGAVVGLFALAGGPGQRTEISAPVPSWSEGPAVDSSRALPASLEVF